MNLGQVQQLLGDWLVREFSPVLVNPASQRERSMRVLEESVELCQSCGLKEDEIWTIIQRVMKRPPQKDFLLEAGQTAITLLAFFETTGFSMEAQIFHELKNILNHSQGYYTERMARKVLDMPALYHPIEIDGARNYLKAKEQK